MAIASALAAAGVAIWTKVLKPFLVWAHRQFSETALRAELETVQHVKRSVEVLGRQYADVYVEVESMKPDVQKIPVIAERTKRNTEALARIERSLNALLIQLGGQQGGHRRTDPP